jgi:hypothetical protein
LLTLHNVLVWQRCCILLLNQLLSLGRWRQDVSLSGGTHVGGCGMLHCVAGVLVHTKIGDQVRQAARSDL